MLGFPFIENPKPPFVKTWTFWILSLLVVLGFMPTEFRTLQGSCSGAGAAKSQILDNDHNRVFTAFIFMKVDLLFSYYAEKNCAISQMSNHNFLKKIPAGMRVKTQGFAEAPNMFSAQQWTTPKSFSDSAL